MADEQEHYMLGFGEWEWWCDWCVHPDDCDPETLVEIPVSRCRGECSGCGASSDDAGKSHA